MDEVVESAVLISDMVSSVKKCCDKILESSRQNSILQELLDLKKQSSIIQHISAHCTKSAIGQWYTMVSRLPQSIYHFSSKGLILCLPTKVNMRLWSKSDNDHCSLCDQKQSQLHVLSYCQVALREKRYTWIHNSILLTIARFLSVSANSRGMKLFVDLDGYPNPGECFGSQRPDIVIINGKEVIVIELSVCYETRTEEARHFKKRRNQNLKSDLSIEWEKLNIIYLEITTLGFVSRNIKDFAKFVKPLGISYERMIGKCMETALRASFYIFTRRDKEWSNPELLNFYQL